MKHSGVSEKQSSMVYGEEQARNSDQESSY